MISNCERTSCHWSSEKDCGGRKRPRPVLNISPEEIGYGSCGVRELAAHGNLWEHGPFSCNHLSRSYVQNLHVMWTLKSCWSNALHCDGLDELSGLINIMLTLFLWPTTKAKSCAMPCKSVICEASLLNLLHLQLNDFCNMSSYKAHNSKMNEFQLHIELGVALVWKRTLVYVFIRPKFERMPEKQWRKALFCSTGPQTSRPTVMHAIIMNWLVVFSCRQHPAKTTEKSPQLRRLRKSDRIYAVKPMRLYYD